MEQVVTNYMYCIMCSFTVIVILHRLQKFFVHFVEAYKD